MKDLDTHRDERNYERNYERRNSHRDRYKYRDERKYERNYEKRYSHRDRYKNRDERKYENRNYNSNKPDYINNLIKFNKKELNLNNPLEASNYFVTIVKDALNDNNYHFDGKNLSMLFVGAKKYNIKYNNWKNNKSTIFQILISKINLVNSQGISNILNSLSKMNIKWTDFDFNNNLQNNLIRSVEHNVNHFNPQEIANTLLALYQLGLKWTNFNDNLQNNLIGSVEDNVNQFNPQNIANTLLALVKMKVSINELCILKLLRIININFNNIVNDESISQIGQVLTRILLTSYGINLSNEVNILINEIKSKKNKVNLEITESHLQNDVFRILKKLNKDIEMEYKCGIWDCITVDIYIKNSNTVIEVNGPNHFDFKNEYNLKTLRKKELLIELGFNYIDISYKEWNSLNNDEEKLVYLKTKLSV